jgi:NAD+ synthase
VATTGKKADASAGEVAEKKPRKSAATKAEAGAAAEKKPRKASVKAADAVVGAGTEKKPRKSAGKTTGKITGKTTGESAGQSAEENTDAQEWTTLSADVAEEPAAKAKRASRKKPAATEGDSVATEAEDKAAYGGPVSEPEPVVEAETPPVPPAFPDTSYAVVEKLLTGFVAHEVRKVGLMRAVLGLSGGVDSAVSAAVAARALGPQNVLGIFLPYSSSSPESEADARAVADSLGIELLVVDITPQVDAYFARFPDASRLRRGNKMARERMTILYDHSAARSALVIGTSNKTELLLGYGTLYGDMASALNPIGDLYKTQVWGLARHLGLPASVIDKAPTADLWSGQTDETELGFSYHEVDRLLYRMIDDRCSHEELAALGFDAAFVERISRMVRSSQFKRRLPIIAKLSARSIDTDFRYSRDWGL